MPLAGTGGKVVTRLKGAHDRLVRVRVRVRVGVRLRPRLRAMVRVR